MPVYSMTGYANASGSPDSPTPAAFHEAHANPDSAASANREIESSSGSGSPASTARLNVEIRSVNSRFLDLVFKLPDELRHVEPALRELLTARFKRGKIELRLAAETHASATAAGPDAAQLDRLAHIEARVISRLKHAKQLSVYEALLLCKTGGTPAEDLDAAALDATRLCVERLVDSRAREGGRLAAILLTGVGRLRELGAQAEPLVPAAVERQQTRFLERWNEALAATGGHDSISRDASRERALNEAAAYAIRIDVAEELARLRSHLEEIARLVESGGEVGKRLDFLIQELLREANTLASKSSSLEMTGISVDMKVAIEQLREQVQNIE